MTYKTAKHRSAMTAIAAALALSATPLFAQETVVPDPPPETASEPVTETSDPLAPEPTAPEAPVVTETASQPANTSKPVAKTKAATRPVAAPARPSATRSSGAATNAPAEIAAPAADELIDAPAAPPVEATPAPAPASAESASLDEAQKMDTMLELGGAGLLALAAAGVALRTRSRRKEEERIEEAKWAYIEAHPEADVEREPAFARSPAPRHDLVPATSTALARTPVTKLPKGFDLSRFGPHVQDAYRGPTPDNPSLSLRYRLRRASFLDQKERAGKEAAAQAAKIPAKGNWESRSDAAFLFRRAGTKNSAEPAFQR
jgi:hypothetical protein